MTERKKAFHTTKVEANKTKGQIRDLLVKYGATQFGIMEEEGRALVGFHAQGRTVRIEVPLPLPLSFNAKAEEMRIWRAVRAWIFAQLAAVDSGIKTFEEAFLADTVLPSGETFSHWAAPQIKTYLTQGQMPALLPPRRSSLAGGEGSESSAKE